MVDAKTKEWLRWMSLASVPLVELDEDEKVVNFASGCLVKINQRVLLLSVLHATGKGHWVAEVGFDSEMEKTEVHHFGRQWAVIRLDPKTSNHAVF